MIRLREVPSALLLSYQTAGLRGTLRHASRRLFGREDVFVLLRYLSPVTRAVELPVEVNGFLVRRMSEVDLDRVAQLIPSDLTLRSFAVRRRMLRQCLEESFVVIREGNIVGASWYTAAVNRRQPWYRLLEGDLISPLRLNVGIFVIPGAKGAAWTLARTASDVLAARGVRTVVGVVRARNQSSLVLSRLLGSRVVARQATRYFFGRAISWAERIDDTRALVL